MSWRPDSPPAAGWSPECVGLLAPPWRSRRNSSSLAILPGLQFSGCCGKFNRTFDKRATIASTTLGRLATTSRRSVAEPTSSPSILPYPSMSTASVREGRDGLLSCTDLRGQAEACVPEPKAEAVLLRAVLLRAVPKEDDDAASSARSSGIGL